ncbi:hypothetical protein D3C78_1545870 [compost metagenome]
MKASAFSRRFCFGTVPLKNKASGKAADKVSIGELRPFRFNLNRSGRALKASRARFRVSSSGMPVAVNGSKPPPLL